MTIATIEMSADEVEQLRADLDSVRAERDHLREQIDHLRDVNVRLGRAEADNAQTQRAATTLAAERDTARAELREMGNALAEERAAHQATAAQLTRAQGHLDDAEEALVEANASRRLSNAEHLHQRLSAASLVIGRLRDWRYCPLCQEIRERIGLNHTCGRLIPVDAIIIRRTREKP